MFFQEFIFIGNIFMIKRLIFRNLWLINISATLILLISVLRSYLDIIYVLTDVKHNLLYLTVSRGLYRRSFWCLYNSRPFILVRIKFFIENEDLTFLLLQIYVRVSNFMQTWVIVSSGDSEIRTKLIYRHILVFSEDL